MDPDLGWHIRYGQIILSGGLPQSDPFSYTMPSYNYANHEWLLDIIFVLLVPLTGFTGLSLIFALIATSTIFLALPKSLKVWQLSIIFLAAGIFLSFTGIRPQLISWLLFLIVLKIISKGDTFLLLVPIFLFWANIHGGFVIGIAILIIYLVSKFLAEGKLPVNKVFIIFLSILVTLINPYQLKLWQEILSILTDHRLKRIIVEWFPIIFAPHPLIIIWFFIFVFLFIKYFRNISIFEKMLYAALFLNSLLSIRNTPYFVLATIPFISASLKQYFEGLKKIPAILYKKIPFIIFSLLLTIFLATLSQIFSNSNMQTSVYPDRAVEFLKQLKGSGEIFAPYNWGGYLIWQYPQKRVFIDGRMPSWKQQKKAGESEYALDEYFKITSKSEFASIFKKYNIEYALLPNYSEGEPGFSKKILSLWQDMFTLSFPVSSFIKTLEDFGWEKIYEDEVSVIYKR